MNNQVFEEKEFYEIAKPILRNPEFQRRKNFLHHRDSVYDHSICVALVAYKMAKRIQKYKKLNINDVVVGALLHDFYLVPWRENKNPKLLKKHGFTHGKIAANNSYQFFPKLMNDKISDAIEKHMFPLTMLPPKYVEGWIINMADKCVSLDVFKVSVKLPRYTNINITYQAVANKCRFVYNYTKKVVSNMY